MKKLKFESKNIVVEALKYYGWYSYQPQLRYRLIAHINNEFEDFLSFSITLSRRLQPHHFQALPSFGIFPQSTLQSLSQ